MSDTVEILEASTEAKLGNLPDAITCAVTEELNTSFEATLTYPVVGENYSLLALNRLLKIKPNPYEGKNIFRIYKITRPINGIVTVYAEHLTYAMNGYTVFPCADYAEEAGSASTLLAWLDTCASENAAYSGYYSMAFSTDVTDLVKWEISGHKTIKECLKYARELLGGDWRFGVNSCRLVSDLGQNRGVELSYGVQMTDFSYSVDNSERYTHLMPFWRGTLDSEVGEEVVYLEDKFYPVYVDASYADYFKPYVVDLSGYYPDDKPTEEMLRTACAEWLMYNSEKIGMVQNAFSVSFFPLHKTAEYSGQADSEHIEIGDYVKITNTTYGVSEVKRCIKTVYNVLADCLTGAEFGTRKKDITEVINQSTKKAEEAEESEAVPSEEKSEADEIPKKIVKVSDNKVEFYLATAKKKITWVASGTGNTRQNFKKTAEEWDPGDSSSSGADTEA